ncbi:hypothetical protein D8S78_16760 [Natrialba swarupiae]|nr:hypothetical protein [Natrialba swarupiae]
MRPTREPRRTRRISVTDALAVANAAEARSESAVRGRRPRTAPQRTGSRERAVGVERCERWKRPQTERGVSERDRSERRQTLGRSRESSLHVRFMRNTRLSMRTARQSTRIAFLATRTVRLSSADGSADVVTSGVGVESR